MLTLEVTKRDGATTLSALRKADKVPAIVYGAHQEATPITIDGRAFDKAFREAGEATIVSLTGLGAAIPSLIHDIYRDPITGAACHVDFYAVTKGEKVEVAIPLEFVGESDAAKAGANVVKVLHEVEVKADPMQLPHNIEVDLSALAAIDDRICAKDLKLPSGVELMLDPEEVVALAQAVVEEKEEAAPADISSIEVEKKGKEESEEAAA